MPMLYFRSAALLTAWLLTTTLYADFAFLGVNTEPVRANDANSGLRVVYLFPTGAAETMGLKVGDEIIALNDIIIPNRETFIEELRREKVGATVRFFVRRGDEKLQVKGKIGSYEKTLGRLQERQRKEGYGKPFDFEFPPLTWWDPEAKAWAKTPKDPKKLIDGKLSVIFSFDNCPTCREKRYTMLFRVAQAFQSQSDFAFVGLYQSDAQEQKGKAALLDGAKGLFAAAPPPFAAAVVTHKGGKSPRGREREGKYFLYSHGLAVVDQDGKLRYLQILGVPEQEFGVAYTKLAKEVEDRAKGGEPSSNDGSPEPAPKKEGE